MAAGALAVAPATPCALGQDSPCCAGKHAVVWHGYVGLPKDRHQSAAGLWHPFTALVFVIRIISAAIMLKNGCFFLNKRKVAARISRIKACLAGNQCGVLKNGQSS